MICNIPLPCVADVSSVARHVLPMSAALQDTLVGYIKMRWNIIFLIGLFCKKRPIILRSLLIVATPYVKTRWSALASGVFGTR